jgi:hypothetical protein
MHLKKSKQKTVVDTMEQELKRLEDAYPITLCILFREIMQILIYTDTMQNITC